MFLTLDEAVIGITATESGKTFIVVSVSDHKTAYLGPFQIPMVPKEYTALKNVARFVKGNFPHATVPFVSVAGPTVPGNSFTASRIAREFMSACEATGMFELYGVNNATKNRKNFATSLAQNHPQLRDATSKQLKHSTATDRIYNDLGTTPAKAVKIDDGGQSNIAAHNTGPAVIGLQHVQNSTAVRNTGPAVIGLQPVVYN
jgi:hypothetical protein